MFILFDIWVREVIFWVDVKVIYLVIIIKSSNNNGIFIEFLFFVKNIG